MRCWWINHYAIPPNEPGGTRHYSLAKKLKAHGIEVTIIASSFNYVQRKERLQANESHRCEVIDGVPFVWLRTRAYSGNSVSKLLNMLSFVRHLRRRPDLPDTKPDIIIGSSPHPFAADEARRIARRLNVPFCLEIRDLWPQTLTDVGGLSAWHPVVLWMRRIERRLYRAARCIVTLLPNSRKYFESHGVSPSSIKWIPNGIDRDMLPPPRRPLEDGCFRIMFVGIHGLVYGLETVVEAASILQKEHAASHIRFVLVGDGPQKQGLIDRAEQLGLNNIEFRDSVPKSDVYDVMQQADALLMPLKQSAVHEYGISPNKLFEYMSVERPVIFAAESSANLINEADAGMTIPPQQPAELARAAVALDQLSQEERDQMGRRGRSWVEANYDLDSLAAGLADALRVAAGDSSA
ncbi:MAG: glycosyltransferase family 4 protein [Phycisphaerales bacterium]|nr:glycosyltransferase family 4 protein [Phycisphaerales bacterium]